MDLDSSRHSLRGLKKCSFCSKFNGNRVKGCRNPDCPQNKMKTTTKCLDTNRLDVVALLSRGDYRLFSVKTREKCPESVEKRSFVKITDKIVESEKNGSTIHRSAICYVDSCKYDSGNEESVCKHMKEASDASVEAVELTVKKETLYSIAVIPEGEKLHLWQEICNSAASPMVQKINKKIFVVRHENSPAGYVHCELSSDIRGAPIYSCSCKVINILSSAIVMEKEICRHMMLLSAALNSDIRLQTIYKSHLDLMKHIYSTVDPTFVYQPADTTTWAEDLDQIEFITSPTGDELVFGDSTILNNATDSFVELQDCQIELMDNYQLTDQLDLCADDLIDPLSAPTMTSLLETILPSNEQIHIETVRLKTDKGEGAPKSTQWSRRIQTVLDRAKINSSITDADCTLNFEQWLGMFVERINLAPDFNSVCNPITLNFTVHTNFFNYLHMRFSKDPTKRKLPNKCEVIREGVFAGKVQNIFQFSCGKEVKRILENNLVKLQLERHFNKKSNIFTPMTAQELAALADGSTKKGRGKLFLLKPTEYKTFIKLGPHCDDGINHCFSIKWIADMLPMKWSTLQ
ncbi:hypothetical protein DMENIID0001_016840 [Sergentomyia squamirostris]